MMTISAVNVIPLVASADDYVKANLNMVYLGNGEMPATEPIKEVPNVSQMNPGDTFWIGMQLDNLMNLDQNTPPSGYSSFITAHTSALGGTETASTGGFTSLSFGVNYLADYIEPDSITHDEGDYSIDFAVDYDSILATNPRFVNTAYSLTVNTYDTPTDFNLTGYSPTILDKNQNINSLYMYIDNTSATKRLYRLKGDLTEDNDDVIYGYAKFKVKATPPAGVKVLDAALNARDYVFQVGTDGNRWKAQWNDNTSITPNENLNNYFTYSGTLNLNPSTYTVKFYNDKDAMTADNSLEGKDLTIEEGESVSTTSGASLPAESDLTIPANNVFTGFVYEDPQDDSQTIQFNENTVFNPLLFANPTDTVLKVYATYEVGHTVTFNSNYSSDMTDAPSATTKPVTVANTATSIDVSKKPTMGKADDTPAPDFIVPDGYAFKEWNTDPNGSGITLKFSDDTTPTDVVGDNVTEVYAIWEKAVTLTFHKNDGSGDKSTAIGSPTENFTGTVPTVTRDNYTFVEWNTESNGSGTGYTDAAAISGTTFTTDTDLYAIWTPDNTLPTSTLTFDPVRTDVTPNPQSVTVNTNDLVFTANIPVFNIADYTYTWHESAALSDTNEIDFDTGYAVTEDKTVYAHWTYTGADAVTVNFYDEDGTTKLFDTQVAPNTKIPAASMPVATKTGASFKEWRTATGGGGDVFDENYTITANIDVYAVYSPDIKITYDPNSGTNDSSITGPVIGAISDIYTNPADPTRTSANGSYKFLGWNTKQNGSGDYVEADGSKTYGDISTNLFDGAAEITVYAQWAAVPDDDKDKVKEDDPTDPANPDPTNKGVKVTFDSNVGGNLTNGTVTDANRKYYYPVYGDSLGSLPESPTRDNYVFQKWNTKPDGSGTDITATTEFGDNLGDDLQEIAGTNISYEITVYAIWDIDPNVAANDQITITFNANKDGKGTASADDKVIKVYRGDSVGYDVNPPENGTFEFASWFEGTADVTTGVIEFDVDKEFDPTAAIDPAAGTTVTYYADWDKFLKVELVDNGSGSNTAEANYTGNVIVPKYTIYQMDQNGDKVGNDIVTNSDLSGTDYVVSYTKNGTVTDLKDVGTYGIDVSVSNADLAAQGVEVGLVVPAQFEVKGATLTIKVDPDTQKQKKDASGATQKATITADGLINGEALEDVMDIKYYLWTDAENSPGAGDADGEIQDTELSEVADPTDLGKYVIKITPKENSNYAVGTVTSSVEGKNVELYPTAAGTGSSYPIYAAGEVGKNIVFEIQANDPSADNLTVQYVKPDPDNEGSTLDVPATLKDSDYKTDKTFDNTETATDNDYYILVSPDATDAKITILPKNDSTTVDVKVGDDSIALTDAPSAGDPSIKEYTATIELDENADNVTTATITMTASDGVTKHTYTVTIKKSQARIALNPGNSPYGEIEKDNSIADKAAAKAAFDSSMKLPSLTSLTFYNEAWNSYTEFIDGVDDAGNPIKLPYNGDKDENAIFIYQRKAFKDPGFTLYDGAGDEITDTSVIDSVNLSLNMTSYRGGVAVYDTADNAVDISATGTGNEHLFTEFMNDNIRPDVYVLNYEFNDPLTGSKITTKRYVVAISRLGDVRIDANDIINNNDAADVKSKSGVLNAGNSLYMFKIADARCDANLIINNNDAADIKSKSMNLPLFYNYLPEN